MRTLKINASEATNAIPPTFQRKAIFLHLSCVYFASEATNEFVASLLTNI